MKCLRERLNEMSIRSWSEPIKDKTILFYGVIGRNIRGGCLAVLKYMLSEKKYRDWNFIISIPNNEYSYVLISENNTDMKIEYVLESSIQFVSKLYTASFVVIGKNLPDFYIKKDGQKLIGAFDGNYLSITDTVSKERVQKTIITQKLDYIYVDESEDKILNYLMEEGQRCLQGPPLRFTLAKEQTKQDRILVSLSLKNIGNIFNDLENKYNDISAIIGSGRWEICFRLPIKQYIRYQSENAPDILKNICPVQEPLSMKLTTSRLLITDNIDEMLDAVKNELFVIFYTHDNLYREYLTEMDENKVAVARSWSQVTENLRVYFCTHTDLHDTLPIQYNIPWKLFDNIFQYGESGESPNISDKKILFVVPSTITDSFWNYLNYLECSETIHVLIRSTQKGKLWDKKIAIKPEIKVFCKIGAYQRNDNISLEESIRCEWRRTLGDNEYADIIAWKNDDKLWNQMYQFPPARKITLAADCDYYEKVLAYFHNPLLDNINKQEIGLDERSINDNIYYFLGQIDKDCYYMRKKNDLKKWFTCLVEEKNQEYYNKLIHRFLTERPDCNIILVDPEKVMISSPHIRSDRINYIPDGILSLRLLFASEGVIVRYSKILRMALDYLNVPIIGESPDEGNNKFTQNADVLICDTLDEIVQLDLT